MNMLLPMDGGPTGLLAMDLWPLDGSAFTATLPLDLVDAVELYLTEQFVETSQLTWVGAGALPPGLAMPFASIGPLDEEPAYQSPGTTDTPYDDHGTIAVMVAASTRSSAKSLTKQIGDALTDAPLVFGDGTLLYLRRGPRSAPVCEDESAPAGQQTWISHLMLTTIVSRTF